MNLFETLKRAADAERVRLNPLPTHALAQADEHLRRQYALVLTAALSAQETVSATQSRLLLLLLESLALGDQRAALFEAVRAWDEANLTQALRAVRDAQAAQSLVVDVLVLLRIDAPLSEPMAALVTDMADFLGVSEQALAEWASHSAAILDIKEVATAYTVMLGEYWPARLPQRLTLAALQAGISGGLWLLAETLAISAAWSARDAVFVFRNGAAIQTTLAGGQELKLALNGCRLISARLVFSGKGALSVDDCDFTGTYDAAWEASAIWCKVVNLTVQNSRFTLTHARALACEGENLSVSSSNFTACGYPTANGGAIYHNGNSRKIEDSRFERCSAARGGAIYTNNLNDIKNCEFIACASTALKDAPDIAVYCENEAQGNPAVSGCTFRNTSLYLGSAYWDNHKTFVLDSQFDAGNIYYHNRYGSNTIQSNCVFNKGREIAKEL